MHTLQQSGAKSCGAACCAVAIAELNMAGAPTQLDEDAIYQQISRDYANGEVSSPAKIVRELKNRGFRSSLLESPYRTGILLTMQTKALAPEWLAYSGELYAWDNWIWRWPRGLRERDFDHNARVLMVCATPDGLHYLLARREGGTYYVMDPADNSNTPCPNFTSWAGLHWTDGQSWNPGTSFYTCRDNWYLGIAIWVNHGSAPYVMY